MVRYRSVLAALFLAVAGCARPAPPPSSAPALPVDTARVEERAISTAVRLDGQIVPLREANLGLQQSGTVSQVLVDEGDHVAQGQILARIDDATLQAQAQAADAAVRQADAALAGSARTLPIQTGQLGGAVVQAQQQLAQARNALESARAAELNARTQLESDEALAKDGFLARTTLVNQRAQETAARQSLASAQNAVRNAESELAVSRGNVGQSDVQRSDVAAKRAAAAQARAQLRLLRTQIDQTVLRAPFDGEITQRLLDPGAYAGPNQPIVRISDLHAVYVNANVPDEDLAYVRAGTPVRFTSASLPGRSFRGEIAAVNAVPTQGTLSYRARIRQPNPDRALRGGMLVTLDLRKAFAPRALVIPRPALAADPHGGAAVYVVTDGRARLVPVRVGVQNDDAVQIEGAGIAAGTTVVATRPDALANGTRVSVVGSAP